jgi:hypothetical protein
MAWHRRRHPECEHPLPAETIVQVVITDAAGNVRAVREAAVLIQCGHWEREDDGAVH